MISKSLVSAPYHPFLAFFFAKEDTNTPCTHIHVSMFKQCVILFFPDINKGV